MKAIKKFVFAVFPLVFFSLPFLAESKKEMKTTRYDLSENIQQLQIQLRSADLTLRKTKKKKSRVLTIQYEGSLDSKEEESLFSVFDRKALSKKTAWLDLKKRPKMSIWIPSNLLVQVSLFKGEIEVKKFWKTALFISLLGKGSVKTNHTSGNLQIFQGSGKIVVNKHEGDVKIQGENSQINIQSCKGKVEVKIFKGQISVQKSAGKFHIRSFKGSVLLKDLKGELSFLLEKKGIVFKPFRGSITGESKEGNVRGVIYPKNVNISTDRGMIFLDFPKSRAWVTAESWEGRIRTPAYFHRTKTGGMDRSKGQLRGSQKRGKVSLKSRIGSIKVYQSVQ